MSSRSQINLGWAQLTHDLFTSSGSSDDYSMTNEKLFFDLFSCYHHALREEKRELLNYGFHTINSPWYISEIEDLVRYGLLLYDKIVVQIPSDTSLISNDSYETGYIYENLTTCNYTFFSWEVLMDLQQIFGDALESKEIVLLPRLEVDGRIQTMMKTISLGDRTLIPLTFS